MISENPTSITDETTISSTLVQSARVPNKNTSKQHSRYNSVSQQPQ